MLGLHLLPHSLLCLVHLVEVCTDVQVDIIEVYVLYFLVDLSVCCGIFYGDDQARHLGYVTPDDDDQDDHVICLDELTVVLILVGLLGEANKEDEGGCEEAQQGQIEDIHAIVAQLPLRDPPNDQSG